MERTESGKNQDSVQFIKTAPQGKQSRLYISSYFENDLDCIHFSLKFKCHFLVERCITISEDPKMRNQHIIQIIQNLPTYSTIPHIHFYFPINSCPARQEFSHFLLRHRNQQQIEIYLYLALQQYLFCVILASYVPQLYIKASCV